MYLLTTMTNPDIANDENFINPVREIERGTPFVDTDVAGNDHTYRTFQLGSIPTGRTSTIIYTREA